MAYVITEPCIGVKDKGCVSLCPMDCIHEGKTERDGVIYDMMFINPKECTDCGLCESECPVGAIFFETDVPRHWQHFIPLNASFFQTEGS